MKISEIITDKYKLRIPPTVYYELLADVQELEEQEPKFIAKSDGTIEQIKNCNDCLFKKEWEKIGKLISVVLKKQTEQEPTPKNNLGVDLISRADVSRLICEYRDDATETGNERDLERAYGANAVGELISELPSVTPQEPRWIPVSERLPDTDDEVLCWYEYYHWSQEKVLPEYGLGCYFKETKSWFGEVANGHKVRVIAWMPLPKPYEPQESENNK